MSNPIDLPLDHDMRTDCPVPPDTIVRVQYAGLNFDPSCRLGLPCEGRADQFCWSTVKHPMVNAIVARYEVLSPSAQAPQEAGAFGT